MQVKEIMTPNPATCSPETSLQDVARMMVDCDCGAIPVVKSNDSNAPVGIITDRDIVIRCVAAGHQPTCTVKSHMTPPPMAVAHHIIRAFVERGADVLELRPDAHGAQQRGLLVERHVERRVRRQDGLAPGGMILHQPAQHEQTRLGGRTDPACGQGTDRSDSASDWIGDLKGPVHLA